MPKRSGGVSIQHWRAPLVVPSGLRERNPFALALLAQEPLKLTNGAEQLDSHLPSDKSLATFDFATVPAVSKAHVMALAEADGWIAQGHDLLAFGPPGVGKTHLIAGIGHALIDHGYKVLFVRTSELVQRLQAARRDLRLPGELAKLDRFDPVRSDRRAPRAQEHHHHGQRTLLGVGRGVPRLAMTVAAVDRLVHHATILEMNVPETDPASSALVVQQP